ncbi:MAG: HAD-IA family hydrolase, partial [Omnitrophica WOR_2 bacterium]
FDFGRVLLNIDPRLTQIGLAELGYRPDDESKGAKDDAIVTNLESGKIRPDEFISSVLSVVTETATSNDIIRVWNAMLLDFPEKHVKTLLKLKQNYRIFLLSNSNQIHYDFYIRSFRETYGFELSSLFEKMWFSFQLGMIKPNVEIFEYILRDANILASETLFVDDTLMHIESARKTGIRGFHLDADNDISDLF